MAKPRQIERLCRRCNREIWFMANGQRLVILEGRGPETRRHECNSAATALSDDLRCRQWLWAHGVPFSDIPALLNEVRDVAMTRTEGQLRNLDAYAFAPAGVGLTFLLDELWIRWHTDRYFEWKASIRDRSPRGSDGDFVGLGDVYREILARRPVAAA